MDHSEFTVRSICRMALLAFVNLASSGDPDKMSHFAAFHEDHLCLQSQDKAATRREYNFFVNHTVQPLNIYNGPFRVIKHSRSSRQQVFYKRSALFIPGGVHFTHDYMTFHS